MGNVKKVINGFCKSKELEVFKEKLQLINEGIDNNDLDLLIEGLAGIKDSSRMMEYRLNLLGRIILETYLTNEQLRKVDLDGNVDGLSISIKDYIPAYFDKSRKYVVVDTKILEVDFINKELIEVDIEKVFSLAIKEKKREIADMNSLIGYKRNKVEEMNSNKSSKSFVVDAVMNYNKTALNNKAFEKVKCVVSKNKFNDYMCAYEEIKEELNEEISELRTELTKLRSVDYNYYWSLSGNIQKEIVDQLKDKGFKAVKVNKMKLINSSIDIDSDNDVKEIIDDESKLNVYDAHCLKEDENQRAYKI